MKFLNFRIYPLLAIALFTLAVVAESSARTPVAETPHYDLVLSNGQVIDGTGTPSRIADIGVVDGRIAAIGQLADAAATQRVDVTGKVVAPGFIDVHSHADAALATPATASIEGFLRQGVTTAVFGVDGFMAYDQLRDMAALAEQGGAGINFLSYIGHNAVRREVMGMDNRAPTADEMSRMQAIVRQAMEFGAAGLSTGLMYLPGSYASTQEVIDLATVTAPYGALYDSHVRDPANALLESHRECLDIAQAAGVDAHPGHVKAVGGKNFGKGPAFVDMIQTRIDQGQKITVDLYPYDGAATAPIAALLYPGDDPRGNELLARLGQMLTGEIDSEEAAQVLTADLQQYWTDVADNEDVLQSARERTENPPADLYSWVAVVGYQSMRIVVSDNPALEGRMLVELAGELGLTPFEFMRRVTVAEGGKAMVTLGAIQEEDIRVILRQPWAMVSSDGAELAPTHPRGRGTFPRLLGRYAREWGVLSMEEAVHKITGLPASYLKLPDRGVLRVGAVADIVVFDPATVIDRSTWSEPALYATGIERVYIGGEPALQDDVLNPKRLGRFIPFHATPFHATLALGFNAADLGNPAVIEAFVDGVVKPLMAEGHSPSGTFALMKDNQLVFAKGYGWQNIEKRIPVDPNTTLFRPGSISKLFTWVSVMQLVEQGKLDLDADINTYLEKVRIRDTFPGKPVTLRHCMTHTPGFEDGALGYLIIEDPEKVIPLVDAMIKYQPTRVNPPGVVGAYSNYCTSIAGLAVGNVSGMAFTDYVRKNIFDVLGMHNSSFDEPLPENLDQHMAIAYKYEGGKYIARPYELVTNFTPAGALAATATDLLLFGGALLNGGEFNGGRILQAETVEEMKKIQFTLDERVRGIGLGLLHYPFGDTDTFGHDGGTTAFFSHLGITPSANLVVAFSFSGPGGGKTYSTLTRALYQEFFPLAQPNDQAPAGFDERAGKYTGTYLGWRGSFTKLEKLIGLVAQTKVASAGDDQLMIGAARYVEIGNNLFRNIENGDRVAFLENENGEVTGFVQDSWSIMSMYKAGFWANQVFNFGLLALSLIVFLAVVLRRLYQRDRFRALTGANKSAARAMLLAAASHLWAVVFFAFTLVVVFDQLMLRIPLLLKICLVFPIIAVLASLYLLYQTVLVWKNGLLGGAFERTRYSIVTLCALFMSWFYYFWSILGFNYF